MESRGWAAVRQKTRQCGFGSNHRRLLPCEASSPWFAYWLKDKGKITRPRWLKTFETGNKHLESWDAWPPAGTAPRKTLFHEDGKLSFDAPANASTAFDSYVSGSRQSRALSHSHRGDLFRRQPGWYTWLVERSAFRAAAPGYRQLETEPLTKRNVTVAGDIVTHSSLQTTGTDSDWG